VALLLSGIGFGIFAIGGALRNEDSAVAKVAKRSATPAPTASSADPCADIGGPPLGGPPCFC
jgi:hypothetical protein